MKSTILSIILAVVLIGGAFYLAQGGDGRGGDGITLADNVSIVDGKQIIEIRAKGGYQPRQSVAQVGIPTIIRFNGKGSFDCSLAVRIPSMGVSQTLSRTEFTDIDIGIAKEGILNGSCSMGMYPFQIVFKDKTSS